jgi:hypothetical protein
MIAATVGQPKPWLFYTEFAPVVGELLAMADAFLKIKRVCENQADLNVPAELRFIVNRSREVIAEFEALGPGASR